MSFRSGFRLRSVARILLGLLLNACQPPRLTQQATAERPGSAATTAIAPAPTISHQASSPVVPATSMSPFANPTEPPPTVGSGPVVIDPPVPAPQRGTMDHAGEIGWSSDSSEFAYCVVDGGLGAKRCVFLGVAGTRVELSDYKQEEPDSEGARAIAARLKRGYALRITNWAYGGRIDLAWSVVAPSEPRAGRAAVFELRAKLAQEQRSVVVDRILAPRQFGHIHPEAIAVSPDGGHLGVVTHAFAGEFSDTFQIRIWPSAEIAARAFNSAGMMHHHAGRFERAAYLFHLGAHTKSRSAKAMYNLACALARLNHHAAERALAEAIQRGGASVAEKARTDTDFDAVRATKWFSNLAGQD